MHKLLSKELGRVSAPEELWERIQYPQVARSRGVGRRLAWALAACVPVVAMVWLFQPQPVKQAPAVHQVSCAMCHT
jgi:hypothetical protein